LAKHRQLRLFLRKIHLEANRQVLDAPDEAGTQAFHRTRQFGERKPLRELTEDNLQLEPREVSPEAEVLADSERYVQVWIAPDVEIERLVEDLFVAIRRWIE
jgi:hypothetical protein